MNIDGSTAAADHPALNLANISKRFGSLRALEDVSFSLQPNTIHALLGENGAGKTTLMRIAFGMIQPDTGSMTRGGRQLHLRSPSDAIAAGIGMVHQQYSLVSAMTVAENVALGGKGLLHMQNVMRSIDEISVKTGLHVDPSARVRDLSSADRQKVEIVRTLAHDAEVLILDEPTAVLTSRDTADLFRQLRQFVEGGGSVVLITHKLRDALEHADEITVLRRGRNVLSAPAADLDDDSIAAAMLGAAPAAATARAHKSDNGQIIATLTSGEVTGRHETPTGLTSVNVLAGEILGVAALEGAAAPFLRMLAGRTRPVRRKPDMPSNVGFVPENRVGEALIPGFTLAENFAIKDAAFRSGILRWELITAKTQDVIREFDVHASGPDAEGEELSGGNQQRFVLGRELHDNPLLLVLENPTQGLDVSAAAGVHTRLRNARDSGTAVVFYSSDLDEVIALSDRVLVVGAAGMHEATPDRDEVGRLLLLGADSRRQSVV